MLQPKGGHARPILLFVMGGRVFSTIALRSSRSTKRRKRGCADAKNRNGPRCGCTGGHLGQQM